MSTNEQTRKEKTAAVETLHAEIDELSASIAKLTQEITDLTAEIAEIDKAVAEALPRLCGQMRVRCMRNSRRTLFSFSILTDTVILTVFPTIS